MDNNQDEIAVVQQCGFCANDARSSHKGQNNQFNGRTRSVDVAGIGTGDDVTGVAANDVTGVNKGKAFSGVSYQAPNGDGEGRDGAGAAEGSNNDAEEDGSGDSTHSPPTIFSGRDCQRYCDNCCCIQFDHNNTSLY